MKRFLLMLAAVFMICPLAARAVQVTNAQGHYSFAVPAGWTVDLQGDSRDQSGNADYFLRPIGATDEFPVARVIFVADSFRDDPQKFVDSWKADSGTSPNPDIQVQDEAAYDPATGHFVADLDASSAGIPLTHGRLVMISGKNSIVGIMISDHVDNFSQDVPVLNAMVRSLVMETNTPTPTYGSAPAPAQPAVNLPSRPDIPMPHDQTPMAGPAWIWWVLGGMVLLILMGIGLSLLAVVVALMMRAVKNNRAHAAAARRAPAFHARPGYSAPAPARHGTWMPEVSAR